MPLSFRSPAVRESGIWSTCSKLAEVISGRVMSENQMVAARVCITTRAVERTMLAFLLASCDSASSLHRYTSSLSASSSFSTGAAGGIHRLAQALSIS